MSHIPTRFFTDSFSMQERWDFIDKYSDDCWYFSKIYSHKNKISKSAIKIASVIKIKLDIDLFPLVEKIACKGFDISGGTYAFSMRDNKGDVYYFDSKAKYYTSLNNNYIVGFDNNCTVIYTGK